MSVPLVTKGIQEAMRLLAQEGIGKDRKNQQQGYSFRGIDDVFNALAPVLVKAGLVIIPQYAKRECVERETKSGGALFNVVVEGRFLVQHVEDGSVLNVTTYGEAMDSADKATNKAMSAAYKYMALQLFSIPTEGDNDADAHTPPPVQAKRPVPLKAPAPPPPPASVPLQMSREEVLRGIQSAASLASLAEWGKEAKGLPPKDRDAVRPSYEERKRRLTILAERVTRLGFEQRELDPLPPDDQALKDSRAQVAIACGDDGLTDAEYKGLLPGVTDKLRPVELSAAQCKQVLELLTRGYTSD